MVSSAAATVSEYLEELPAERRAVISKVRALVRKHMPKGYVEAMGWGMIFWSIPLKRYPDTYNGKPLGYVALAAQKNNYTIYLMGPAISDKQDAALRGAYKRAGKKLDMGKCCLHFRKFEDLHVEAVAEAIASFPVELYLEHYEKTRPPKPGKKAA
ncbi:hypothetical protein BWI17_15190 [Betaproteobacteria bacterium GR16-43]|nr:hypothetical protein BWI17_15190 [Betaproteobacteria bacterium GR16-43]